MSVPASAFSRRPKVESAVIRLTRTGAFGYCGILPGFRTFVQAAFGQRRKAECARASDR